MEEYAVRKLLEHDNIEFVGGTELDRLGERLKTWVSHAGK